MTPLDRLLGVRYPGYVHHGDGFVDSTGGHCGYGFGHGGYGDIDGNGYGDGYDYSGGYGNTRGNGYGNGLADGYAGNSSNGNGDGRVTPSTRRRRRLLP